MRLTCLFALLALAAWPQQGGGQAPPALAGCGVHGDTEVLCGARSPEDLEVTPDGKYLIATQFINLGRALAGGSDVSLLDLASKTYSKMAITAEPDKGWGEKSCPGPIGNALISHGSSLAKRTDGAWALYLVNHGGRRSIEMFELRPAAGSWSLVWHGCVPGTDEYNDVAILPDGGFVATYPTALVLPGSRLPLFDGAITGYVVRWTPGKGESEISGTRLPYPNGVVASADGRFLYVNAYGSREVYQYDVEGGKPAAIVKLDFMPDNLTWTKDGHLLAAGIKGNRGECPAGSGTPCLMATEVSEIDPAKMQSRTIYDSAGSQPAISGVSVALRVGDAIYIGAYQGDRLVKVPYKK